jgi:hypothetical protein
MSTRRATWIAATVVTVTLPLYGLSVWLGWTRPEFAGIATFSTVDLVWIGSFVAFAVVGAIIVVKRPGHPIGWLFLAAGAASVVSVTTYEYAVRALFVGASLPAGEVAAWVSAWTWPPGLGLVVVAAVLFPTGRPPSRRWWPVVWVAVAVPALVAVSHAVDLWSERGPELLQDPEVVYGGLPPDLWSMRLMAIAFPVFLAAAVLAMVGLLVRYRRARGEERQQLKVLALLAIVAAPALVAGETIATSGAPGAVAEVLSAPIWLPVAAGVAILRYRLYEIDRVISRTVAYAVITLLLVGVYVAGVVGLGALARGLGFPAGGDLVVAASTLAVAALFGPLRRRVQESVDRRFNRERYDALHTVERFTQRLRDEVDVEVLASEIRAVAARTIQPAHASLWLADEVDA